ncbi:unnamed protein product [Gongylonema pulchrum]|uniref:SMC hinge domain-containing protein n=1 Tax=Gongylonema pulchrum TaxID=637853 RepID=A0A183EHD3_9BILA|nr:unnamed protein product [Gongylonema pulchrum]
MQLSESQVKEYYALKGEATKRCGVLDMELNKLLQEQETDKNNAQFEQRHLNDGEEKKKNRIFPGRVYGRLVDLCQPSHKRFLIAITKILAKHMMSIVCDTSDTAAECITYLKEQRFARETFLPLASLLVRPINEKLR